jgi:hypothetical protein
MIRVIRVIFLLSLFIGSVQAQRTEPKWGYLGDDDQLGKTFLESKHVVGVCVYDIKHRVLSPPFAKIFIRCCVVFDYRGGLNVGDKITLELITDSLPKGEAERVNYIENLVKKNSGGLRFAFLKDGGDGNYFKSEWVWVPEYSVNLSEFLIQLSSK